MSTRKSFLIYLGITLAVLLPMLLPGHILTLDMAFPPSLSMPSEVTSSYLFRVLLFVLNFVIPMQVIEKLLFAAVLLLSGVGMHTVLRHLRSPKSRDQLGLYIAGMLYMINPFTYSRFMAGQYSVLLGYALLPWFTRALLAFMQTPTLRRSLALTGVVLLISIVSIHTLGPVCILALFASSVELWRHRKQRTHLVALGKFLAVGLVAFVALSSYWLIPLLQGSTETSQAITTFARGDYAAFATAGESPLGKFANIIRLQGFWAENQALYHLPGDKLPGWGLIALAVLVLTIKGGQVLWRYKRRGIVIILGGSALLGTMFAIGLFSEVFMQSSLLAGYREPHKFVGLVALFYAVCVGMAATDILDRFKQQKRETAYSAAVVGLVLLPVLFTPTMFWGFGGQLRPHDYPREWFAVNKLLATDQETFNTLFLPWHQYMHFNFAGRIIANPAEAFFDKPVIVSDDPEFRGSTTTKPNSTKYKLGTILEQSTHDQLGSQLAQYQIKYIIFAKDLGQSGYTYLENHKQLELLTENSVLKVYKNRMYKEAP